MDINLHANNWACKGTIIDDVGGKKNSLHKKLLLQ